MIKILRLHSPADRRLILEKFDPLTTTWLVSDLRSKFELQNKIMSQLGFFEDTMIMRASELWTYLLRRCRPQMKVVSRDFAKTWLREEWIRTGKPMQPGIEDVLLELMDDMAHVFSHESGPEIVSDWLKQNPMAKERVEAWFDLAAELFAKLIAADKICAPWIAPWLTNVSDNWRKFWQRPLVVDLGPGFSRPEADLFLQISKDVSVDVIEPVLVEDRRFFFLKKPYDLLRESGALVSDVPANEKSREVHLRKVFRMTSPLSEVKHATATVRSWIAAGVSPESIVVICPEVEDYWPVLETYFQEEGLPVNKDSTIRLHSLAAVQYWLSRLRLAQRSFEYPDLQTVSYQSQEQIAVRFEIFEGLFKNLLDAQDLNRDQQIWNSFSSDLIPAEAISYLKFFGLSLRYWPGNSETENLENILREIMLTVGEETLLRFENWLFWLERIVGRMELKISGGNRGGVQIENLMAADSPYFEKRIFLGLNENNFKSLQQGPFTPSEIEKLFQDTGFHCSHPEQSKMNFEFLWLTQMESREDHFLYSMTSASGGIEAPHPAWVAMSEGSEIELTMPNGTRLDSIQAQASLSEIGKIRNWPEQKIFLLAQQVQEDVDGTEGAQIPTLGTEVLSASQIETFFDCSFKYAAGKLFRLLDETEVDLDPDARAQGKIVHKLFEILATEPRRFDWNENEIKEILDVAVQDVKVGDHRLWLPLREKLVRLALRFLEFEKNEIYPLIQKTQSVEKKFTISIEGRNWTGALDRVDLDAGGKLTVYDYKPRNSKYAMSQWQKENHLQLIFYAWLLDQKQIPELSEYDLHGAFYYVYRDFSLYGSAEGQKKFADFQELFPWVEQQIKDFKEALAEGSFLAKPRDESLCSFCKWSQLCRAPHLMT